MNDLRSVNRTLAPVRTLGPRTGEIVSAPPGQGGGKKRRTKKPNPLFQGARPDGEPRRRARSGADAADNGAGDDLTDDGDGTDQAGTDDSATEAPNTDPLTFQVSRQVRSMAVTALPEEAEEAAGPVPVDDRPRRPAASSDDDDRAPASRPARRRDVVDADDDPELEIEVIDETDDEDDKFPWHYQFDDDEPQELQAKSPLLSRAFRSSVG